jgi:hypothetical protein
MRKKRIVIVLVAYPATFHDMLDGTDPTLEFDSDDNPIDIAGFAAGVGGRESSLLDRSGIA